MQTNLFDNSETNDITARIRQNALNNRIEDLKKYGHIYSCLGQARNLAKRIRDNGVLCKSTDKHTIKILK